MHLERDYEKITHVVDVGCERCRLTRAHRQDVPFLLVPHTPAEASTLTIPGIAVDLADRAGSTHLAYHVIDDFQLSENVDGRRIRLGKRCQVGDYGIAYSFGIWRIRNRHLCASYS